MVQSGRNRCEGFEIRSLRCRGRKRLAWIELQMRALAELRRERVDVLHFHNQPEGGMLSRNLGVPAATFLAFDYFLFHGGPGSLLYPVYRRCLTAFDALLPVSEHCREESAAYWRLDPDRCKWSTTASTSSSFTRSTALGSRRA